MAVAGIGYFFARRGGYSTYALGLAFVSAPVFALMQKRDLDFYETTGNAMYSSLLITKHPPQTVGRVVPQPVPTVPQSPR